VNLAVPIRRARCPTVGKVGLERGIRFAVRGRFVRRCCAEERAARGVAVRLGGILFAVRGYLNTSDKAVAGALIFVAVVAIGIEAIVYFLGP
jgi:hypothetical protein